MAHYIKEVLRTFGEYLLIPSKVFDIQELK